MIDLENVMGVEALYLNDGDYIQFICGTKVYVNELEYVNFDMIKMEGKPGGRLEETELISGIVIDKEFSHPQMLKDIKDAKMCKSCCLFFTF